MTVVVWRHCVFRKSHSYSPLLQCWNQGRFGFWVFWLRGLCSDAWFRSTGWTVMSHPSLSPLFYVSVCLCCLINIFKTCTKKKSEVKVTTTSHLSHSCERNISRMPRGNFSTWRNIHSNSRMTWFDLGSKVKDTVTSLTTNSTTTKKDKLLQ